VVVDLGKEIEGFVPISQLGVEEELEDPAERFYEGDPLELKVIESDPINRRIVLSVTSIPEPPPRPVVEAVEDELDDDGGEAEPVIDEAGEPDATSEEEVAEVEEDDAVADPGEVEAEEAEEEAEEAEEEVEEAEKEVEEAEEEAEEAEEEAEEAEEEAEEVVDEPAEEADDDGSTEDVSVADDAEEKEKES